MTDLLAASYQGTEPFSADGGAQPRTFGSLIQAAVTVALVLVPFAGLGVAVWLAWGHGLNLADIALAAGFYLVTGLGVTIGFHRLFTHRSFTAAPALRMALAVAGSMSFEGDVIGWVAIHRRHHAFTDRPGDPHSPYRYGTHLTGQLRGLVHAHVGWLLRDDPSPASRYAPDMAADPGMRRISAAFPALCVVSLGLPFALGWAIGGSWRTALAALLWAGLVRVTLLQHVTWSVNSLCHVIGSRPFTTRRHDRATNLWPLALLSLGESWHNMHHSDPSCARHGADPRQIDISAAVIRIFERLGWATSVHWPSPARLDSRRRALVQPALVQPALVQPALVQPGKALLPTDLPACACPSAGGRPAAPCDGELAVPNLTGPANTTEQSAPAAMEQAAQAGRRHHAPDLLAALAGERAEPADAAPSAPVLVG